MSKEIFSTTFFLLVGCCLVVSNTAATFLAQGTTLPICPPFPNLPNRIPRPPKNEYLQGVFIIDGPKTFECSQELGWQQWGSPPEDLRVFNYGAILSQQTQEQQGGGSTSPATRATMSPINGQEAVTLPRTQIGPEIGYLVYVNDVDGSSGEKPGKDPIDIKHSLYLWINGPPPPPPASPPPSVDPAGQQIQDPERHSSQLLWTSIEIHPPVTPRDPVPNQPGYIPPHPVLQTIVNRNAANVRAYRLWQSYQTLPVGRPCPKNGALLKVPFRAVYAFYGPKDTQLVSEFATRRVMGVCRP